MPVVPMVLPVHHPITLSCLAGYLARTVVRARHLNYDLIYNPETFNIWVGLAAPALALRAPAVGVLHSACPGVTAADVGRSRSPPNPSQASGQSLIRGQGTARISRHKHAFMLIGTYV